MKKGAPSPAGTVKSAYKTTMYPCPSRSMNGGNKHIVIGVLPPAVQLGMWIAHQHRPVLHVMDSTKFDFRKKPLDPSIFHSRAITDGPSSGHRTSAMMVQLPFRRNTGLLPLQLRVRMPNRWMSSMLPPLRWQRNP